MASTIFAIIFGALWGTLLGDLLIKGIDRAEHGKLVGEFNILKHRVSALEENKYCEVVTFLQQS